MTGVAVCLLLYCNAMSTVMSPGQTITHSIFTLYPQRDTEVKSSFISATKVCYNETVWTSDFQYPLVELKAEPKADDPNTSELIDSLVEFLIEPKDIYKEICLENPMSEVSLCRTNLSQSLATRHLLFPVTHNVEILNTYIKEMYPQGHASIWTVWIALPELMLLCTLWVFSLLYAFGVHFKFDCKIKHNPDGSLTIGRPQYYQAISIVPPRLKHAPGLPRCFAMFSMLILGSGFAHALESGSLKLKKPKVRYKTVTLRPKDVDPMMGNFVRKEYTSMKVDAAVFGRIPHKRYESFKEF